MEEDERQRDLAATREHSIIFININYGQPNVVFFPGGESAVHKWEHLSVCVSERDFLVDNIILFLRIVTFHQQCNNEVSQLLYKCFGFLPRCFPTEFEKGHLWKTRINWY